MLALTVHRASARGAAVWPSQAPHRHSRGQTTVRGELAGIVATTTTLTVSPGTQQDSDLVRRSASVLPATAAGSVQLRQSVDGGVSFADRGGPVAVVAGNASLDGQQILDAAGTGVQFQAVFTATGRFGSSTSAAQPLTVIEENATILDAGGSGSPCRRMRPTLAALARGAPRRYCTERSVQNATTITAQETIVSKATIIVLSDPSGGEEALGRVFNALAAAYDFKRHQRPVEVVFQGTGTRWVSLLGAPDHPAHALYKAVEDTVGGASAACSTVFGVRDDVEREGLALFAGNPVPGTPGLPSLVQYLSDGPVLTF